MFSVLITIYAENIARYIETIDSIPTTTSKKFRTHIWRYARLPYPHMGVRKASYQLGVYRV